MGESSPNQREPQEKISVMSGVSKRLFMALSDFRGEPPQLEDALFQLASVIDATSKYHYPNEKSSKKRFSYYLNSITTDLFDIWSGGRIALKEPRFVLGNEKLTLGDVVYGIRCSSYHDPNEVNDLVHWGREDQIGSHQNKFIVNRGMLHALFALLISDDANKDQIDLDLFTDDHFMVYEGEHYPWNQFVGNRARLLQVLGLGS